MVLLTLFAPPRILTWTTDRSSGYWATLVMEPRVGWAMIRPRLTSQLLTWSSLRQVGHVSSLSSTTSLKMFSSRSYSHLSVIFLLLCFKYGYTQFNYIFFFFGELQQKLELVNGVIFTGGWAKKYEYFDMVTKIFKVSCHPCLVSSCIFVGSQKS